MILIYTGEGKGKTTGAVGTALRSWGHGKRVLILQFLKDQSVSGEGYAVKKIASPDLQMISLGRKCPYPGQICCPGERECLVKPGDFLLRDRQRAEKGLKLASQAIDSECWDVVILDEVLNLCQLLPESIDFLLSIMKQCPPEVDLIITGRSCPDILMDQADLVTYMHLVRHPFQEGVMAKRGIDY
ncbi:cob(I)yrinic acid a,c-diamide adenosyltransferase [Syntrophomonas erecta]